MQRNMRGPACIFCFLGYAELVSNLSPDRTATRWFSSVLSHQSMKVFVMVCWLFFVWGFVRARPDRLFSTGIVLALLFPVPVILVTLGITTVSDSYIAYALLTLSLGIMIFVRLVRLSAQGNRDAQLFLVPFLLASVMDSVRFARGALYYAGWFRTGTGLELYSGDRFTVTWDELSTLLSYLAIRGSAGAALYARSRAAGAAAHHGSGICETGAGAVGARRTP